MPWKDAEEADVFRDFKSQAKEPQSPEDHSGQEQNDEEKLDKEH